MSTIAEQDFEYVRWLIQDGSAIVLEDNKKYLVETRLMSLARREGYKSLDRLVMDLRGQGRGDLYRKVVETMCNNETMFFRDIHPFDAMRTYILPTLITKRATERTINIWSAACSSGQEPYSLAMLIREHFPHLASWHVRIIGSDLSSDILARARQGRYSQLEVNRGLPAPYLVKYFRRDGLDWQIADEVRAMVDFREFNLATIWPLLPQMDVVFLRNVMIYFNVETKRDILARMRRQLRPDGYLFLGAAETTLHLDESYQREQLGQAWSYRLR